MRIKSHKAIFWDLQGTLGGDATGDIKDFQFYPFTYEALKLASKKGYLNIILTNQSRIGAGKLTLEDYKEKVDGLKRELTQNKVEVKEILCCPHTKQDHCSCKKPKTGLMDLCVNKYAIDISKSYVIGDMGKNEVVMAHHAGAKSILVLTGVGVGSLNEFRETWKDYEADYIADNVLEAVKSIE